MLNLNMRWSMRNFQMFLIFIYHLCDAFDNYVDDFNKKIIIHICVLLNMIDVLR
jgi:hypothetical protein